MLTSSLKHLFTKSQKVDSNKVSIFVTNLLTVVVFTEISVSIVPFHTVTEVSVIDLPIKQIIKDQLYFTNELLVVLVAKGIIDNT